MKGQIELREIVGKSLEGNPLGDATSRLTPIYVPPGYHAGQKRYPVVYFLHGFTGSGMAWLNVAPFSPNVPERLERLIETQVIPPCLGVFVDGWTALGGSQWINSEALGNYGDYLAKDVVTWVDGQYRTLPKSEARAVVGKSSGGYGAWVMGAQHPEVFGFVGAHSADAYFEYGYLPEIPKAAEVLRKAGGPEAWWKDMVVRAQSKRMKGEDHATMNVVAMSAAYSPRKGMSLNLELPFDAYTGRILPEVWERWLQHDPVRFVPQHLDSFRKLKSIFVDCGIRDEFHLQYGARMVVSALTQAGIKVLHEEFDDGHMGINYRFDRSLTVLVPQLALE